MDSGVAIPSIDMAVSMRTLSAYKADRLKAAALYAPVIHKIAADPATFEAQVEAALYVSTIICYAQGLSLLVKASEELQMEIPLKDVVKIWRGGCIIRSTLLETFYQAYLADPSLSNILLDPTIAAAVKAGQQDLRDVVSAAAKSGIAIGGIQSSLAYLESFVSAKMPTNLIQAQRDNFGSHTYQRTDKEGIFHTEWGVHP